MTEETDLITDTAEIAEGDWIPGEEPGDVENDMTATRTPENGKDLEFHIQMRRHTMRDFEDLVIEAAARQIIGRFSDGTIAKAIEARCIKLLHERATAALENITAEIIDQPVTPDFGSKEPVTMRELIGLYGREYLQQKVGRDGKPDSWGGNAPRIQHIAEQALERRFKNDIEKATRTAIAEVQRAVKAEHKALIDAEKARFLKALTPSNTEPEQ